MVRKLRLQRGWSQEQLSQFSGLSVRTIQRIEQGKTAGLESLKSLAAVFEVDVQDLQKPAKEQPMNNPSEATASLSTDEQEAIEQVKDVKDFYTHTVTSICMITFLFILNYMISPGYIWAWWAALGMGLSIVFHAIQVFEVVNLFGPDWERKQVEKRLGRKL
ncbi:helix-turn-helix domain-containing protein [Neiella marina]|uniref:Helix-turn-helix domain-containing protein n=1 Tax=Neiella holothuriorum TaxID=2870530 RepID=A0ABS7EJW2_9GAMM|nr:helix-turn-helix domain-containing protein [Neiella holothuriorum]MBW8192639.1 helix-turn-helix domain-containing protein [Neiella holothuriorum]